MSFKSNIYEGIDIAWLFCKEDWKQGRIILPPITDSTGYILVSDQQNNSFHIYSREGEKSNPNNHAYIKTVYLSTNESDGSDVTSLPLNQNFRKGYL